MRTKISLTLGRREPVSRQTAWGCFTTNVALPGFGSLVAGYKVGYLQVVLGLAGLALTTVFGIRFIIWYFNHRPQLQEVELEPDRYFLMVWLPVRWALLGIGIFAIGWLWAMASSLAILAQARKVKSAVPPRIQ
ncbi:MAG: hypothetical protein JWR19_1007 [Pedosphaera sp.]|nr:hypothetical protein [Pedosphaera sp.]